MLLSYTSCHLWSTTPGYESRQMLFETDISAISIVCWQEVVVRIKKLVLFLLRANWLGGCFGALWMWYVGSSWREKKLICSGYLKSLSIPCSSLSYLGLLFARMLQIISEGSEPKYDKPLHYSLTHALQHPDFFAASSKFRWSNFALKCQHTDLIALILVALQFDFCVTPLQRALCHKKI